MLRKNPENIVFRVFCLNYVCATDFENMVVQKKRLVIPAQASYPEFNLVRTLAVEPNSDDHLFGRF